MAHPVLLHSVSYECHEYLYDNFGPYGPILITILSLSQHGGTAKKVTKVTTHLQIWCHFTLRNLNVQLHNYSLTVFFHFCIHRKAEKKP